ncbi:mediator complex [Culex quinquefasciatus]|uniref:Mediator of RNA polymerase II transcription subunit 8 n=1 Tax=Culex quinquefasciatus TaxID=7176 RepID=B0X518_CULQU|nr:mediator complex [Culex quinquefasciatus]|eukprot:XP_001864740.1 mediator complex [Culex quinquefasciatus]
MLYPEDDLITYDALNSASDSSEDESSYEDLLDRCDGADSASYLVNEFFARDQSGNREETNNASEPRASGFKPRSVSKRKDIENKKQGARRRGSRAGTRNLEPERGDKRESDEYDEEPFRKLLVPLALPGWLQTQQLIWESGSLCQLLHRRRNVTANNRMPNSNETKSMNSAQQQKQQITNAMKNFSIRTLAELGHRIRCWSRRRSSRASMQLAVDRISAGQTEGRPVACGDQQWQSRRILKAKEEWDTEASSRPGIQQTSSLADTQALVAAVGLGNGLTLPMGPGGVPNPGLMIPPAIRQASPISAVSPGAGMGKMPSGIKTNIKSANQVHPYRFQDF